MEGLIAARGYSEQEVACKINEFGKKFDIEVISGCLLEQIDHDGVGSDGLDDQIISDDQMSVKLVMFLQVLG